MASLPSLPSLVPAVARKGTSGASSSAAPPEDPLAIRARGERERDRARETTSVAPPGARRA